MNSTTLEDLEASGLSPESISMLKTKPFAEDSPQGPLQGYIIPYFDFQGKLLGDRFHRKRYLPPFPLTANGKAIKYVQPKSSSCHLYIPNGIGAGSLWWFDSEEPLIFTEGEKKAAKACQEGIPTLGLGGIHNWRSKTLELPEESIHWQGASSNGAASSNGKRKVILTLDELQAERIQSAVAEELLQIPLENRQVFIVADTDCYSNPNVQSSVFEFYMWLVEQGAYPCQILLPRPPQGDINHKMGLDDFLMNSESEGHSPKDAFWNLERVHPVKPNLKRWISQELNQPNRRGSGATSARSNQIKIATALVNDLDHAGQRYTNPQTGEYYYFDNRLTTLHEFQLNQQNLSQLRLNSFGTYLNQNYQVATSDGSLLSRLADVFVSREGLTPIQPRRISYASPTSLYYQLSNSHMAKVTAEGIEFLTNGHDDVLFLADQVEPITVDELNNNQQPNNQPAKPLKPLKPKWYEILGEVNLQPLYGLSLEETQTLLAGLFYLNPLFRRWRGLMLPLELTIAEPNSGKTFLYNLRQLILTGRPSLHNPPLSAKDWYTQLTNAGALWVCDNFGTPPPDLKEHMSDELARLITDPDPKIEMRRLYTTASLSTHPIDCSFAITAIKSPFHKGDLIQRSIPIHLNAIPRGHRDSNWYHHMVSQVGGRTQWVLEHLQMAHRFLKAVHTNWSDSYLSDNRLVHFEQSLLMMGIAMGPPYETLMNSAIKKLLNAIQQQIISNDPVIQALEAFSLEASMQEAGAAPAAGANGAMGAMGANHNANAGANHNHKVFRASDIVNWSRMDPEDRWSHVRVLQNAISLGQYLATHAYDVQEICGLSPIKRHNQIMYEIRRRGEKE